MTQPSAQRRRPEQGGYARGEETRARIIAAALQVFGREGYERASTRQIAAEAGVMPPALQYYFHSKEGLHRACAEWIIDAAMQGLGPALSEAKEAAAAGERERALAALRALLDSIADVAVASEDGGARRQFLSRGQADGAGPAFAILRDQITLPINRACAGLVAVVTGRDRDDEETRLRAVLILAQLTALHVNRESTLNILGWTDYGPPRLERVKAALWAHTLAALGG